MNFFKFLKPKKQKEPQFLKAKKKFDLVIFDDIYPHPISGFRLEEYNVLLKDIPNSKIVVNPRSYAVFGATDEDHKNDVKQLISKQPYLKGKINVFQQKNNINTKLFYCIFLNNIFEHLDLLEAHNISFAFTLYPGGGFVVNEEEADFKLKRVLSSKLFRGVIVTQQFSYDYLKDKNYCDINYVKLIFGCVVPQSSLQLELSDKTNRNIDLQPFNVCFCAAKYTEFGQDKGYDVFIEALTVLVKTHKHIRVHVIGGFDASVIDISAIEEQITFYGYQNFEDLSSIYQKMDVFVSPNKPFVLYPGGFDGFPLGTAIEAGLNGAALLLTDALNENICFKENEDFILIKPNKDNLVTAIEFLIDNPEKLKEIAHAGKVKMSEVYSNQNQMLPRIEFLNAIINHE